MCTEPDAWHKLKSQLGSVGDNGPSTDHGTAQRTPRGLHRRWNIVDKPRLLIYDSLCVTGDGGALFLSHKETIFVFTRVFGSHTTVWYRVIVRAFVPCWYRRAFKV